MNVLNYLWSPWNGEAHGRELDIFIGAVSGHFTCGEMRVIGKIRPPLLMSVFTDSKTAAARKTSDCNIIIPVWSVCVSAWLYVKYSMAGMSRRCQFSHYHGDKNVSMSQKDSLQPLQSRAEGQWPSARAYTYRPLHSFHLYRTGSRAKVVREKRVTRFVESRTLLRVLNVTWGTILKTICRRCQIKTSTCRRHLNVL